MRLSFSYVSAFRPRPISLFYPVKMFLFKSLFSANTSPLYLDKNQDTPHLKVKTPNRGGGISGWGHKRNGTEPKYEFLDFDWRSLLSPGSPSGSVRTSVSPHT